MEVHEWQNNWVSKNFINAVNELRALWNRYSYMQNPDFLLFFGFFLKNVWFFLQKRFQQDTPISSFNNPHFFTVEAQSKKLIHTVLQLQVKSNKRETHPPKFHNKAP